MKIFSKVLIILFQAVLAYIITKLCDISTKISINIGYVIGLLIILITCVFFVLQEILNLKQNQKNLKQKMEQSFSNSSQSNIPLNEKSNEVNHLLLMSLCQSLYEPLKFSLLEKSTVECSNLLSALILADFYNSGVSLDCKNIMPRNREKSAEIYEKFSHIDEYGVCYWELGWFYENNLINSARELDELERQKKAKSYYEKSAEKKFPKAYNSLGKFYHYGYGGVEKSFVESMKYYTKAADSDDIYAIMNCGLTCMEEYSKAPTKSDLLDEAEKYFLKAASYNNAEGLFQLGNVYEIRTKQDKTFLNKAKEYYIKALLSVKNQYGAAAYYRLGKLINKYNLHSDNDIIFALNLDETQKLSFECFSQAYNIFKKLDTFGERLDGQYRKYYEELSNLYDNFL